MEYVSRLSSMVCQVECLCTGCFWVQGLGFRAYVQVVFGSSSHHVPFIYRHKMDDLIFSLLPLKNIYQEGLFLPESYIGMHQVVGCYNPGTPPILYMDTLSSCFFAHTDIRLMGLYMLLIMHRKFYRYRIVGTLNNLCHPLFSCQFFFDLKYY